MPHRVEASIPLILETSVDRLSLLDQPDGHRPWCRQGDSPDGWRCYTAGGTPGRVPGFVAPSRRHAPAASSLRAGHPARTHRRPRPTKVSRL